MSMSERVSIIFGHLECLLLTTVDRLIHFKHSYVEYYVKIQTFPTEISAKRGWAFFSLNTLYFCDCIGT